jgi:hypothetical protein
MTLKEKFEKSDILISGHKRVLSQEKVADEFAIGFAEYCFVIFGRLRDNEISIEEALEIYKKEQGL